MAMPEGLITCLPDAELDELVSAVEVLIQEHLPQFAAPVGIVADLRRIFGSRASFGVWGVGSRDELEQALETQAEFVFADWADRDMAIIAGRANTPLYRSAMTPTEIRSVLELGATGALLWPADVIGHVMSGHLERIGLAQHVIPMGGLGAFAASEWIKHGAPAACVDKTLLGDVLDGGDLALLRERCGSFRKVAQEVVRKRAAAPSAAPSDAEG